MAIFFLFRGGSPDTMPLAISPNYVNVLRFFPSNSMLTKINKLVLYYCIIKLNVIFLSITESVLEDLINEVISKIYTINDAIINELLRSELF